MSYVQLQQQVQTMPLVRLTNRQKQCIEFLMQGFTMKEIAISLGISRRTVEDHLIAVKNKLGISSNRKMMIYFFHHLAQYCPN